tara:strand:+ start:236 stop:487 length:252 start_codon:yes stop_codon:yes gene_type:complete
MLENKIKQIVQNNLKDAKVFIHDMTGENNHFNLLVISDEFKNLTLIEQHKIIYNSLDKMITKEIHAVQLKTMTWEQWKKENSI